jgi:CTP synthase
MMIEQNLPAMLARRLRLDKFTKKDPQTKYSKAPELKIMKNNPFIDSWTSLADSVDNPEGECLVALVGKYCDQGDAYLSVVKALTHSAIATSQRLKIEWIDASDLEVNGTEHAWERLRKCDGIVVPGGFGSRGFEGKVAAIKYARESKTPFLGICLGMQAAVIEHCRNVLGRDGAHTSELASDLVPNIEDAVIFMPEGDRDRMGGTMRLGARETILKDGSLSRQLYGSEKIMERHRHRYEVNPAMVNDLEEAGLHFVGRNTDSSGERMEIIELNEVDHPYFVAAQFHPEFTSRPEKPNPLFLGLLQSCRSFHAAQENENEQ